MRPRITRVLPLLCLSAGLAFGQFTLTNAPNPSTVGQAVTLTANPAPSATTVTFYDGSSPQTGTPIGSNQNPNGGPVAIQVSSLTVGMHQLVACWNPMPPAPAQCTNVVSQTVNNPPLTLTSDTNPSTVGQTINLTATPAPPEVTVTFFDGGITGTVIGSGSNNNASYGPVSIPVSTLAAGTHSLSACYTEFDVQTCSNTVNQQVNSPPPPFTLTSTPNPSGLGQAVTLTAAPAPSFSTVTFYDGGSSNGPVLGSGGTGQGSSVTIQVSSLTAGTHQLIACYIPSGNSLFLGQVCSNTVSQQVNSVPTSLALTSSLNPSSPCQPVTFKASITPNTATGSVTFLDGTATLQTVPLTNGSASLTVPSFSLGTHQIQARYVPDPGFGGSSSALAQIVTATATVTLISAPNPSISGQTVTITATVAPAACPGTAPTAPTGTVSFLDGGTQIGQSSLASGTATFSISTLSVGNHGLSALYNGDTNYSPNSSNTVTQVVNGSKPSTTTLTTSANPITTTQSLTLTATVAPSTATGQVQFKDGANTIGTSPLTGGTASVTVSNLAAGTHSLTAIYTGDTNFSTSTSNTVSETVTSPTATNTTTTLTTSANPIFTTQSLTLTATVTPSGATGQVQFKDGATTIGTSPLTGGTASLMVSNLAAGTHSLTAVYSGDTNFNASTSNTVNETITVPVSSTTLSVSPNPANPGQPVTLSATVTPVNATGAVQFLDGATNLGQSNLIGGTATLQISTFTVGPHSLTAHYLGDTVNPPSTSTPVTLTVNSTTSQATSTSLTVTPNPANLGQVVILNAVITPVSGTGPVNGTVTFNDNGSPLTTALVLNGTAVFMTSTLSAGSHTIVAVYNGSTTFNSSSSSPVTLVVNSTSGQTPTQTTFSSSPNPSTFGQPVALNASVAPLNGGGTPTGTVTFSEGINTLGTATLTGGSASFSISTLTVGSHSLVVSYSGDSTFNQSSSLPLSQQVNKATTTTVITASPTSSNPGQPVQLSARVTPSTATGTITFMDGTTAIGAPVTLTGGIAGATTSSLTNGNHSLTAVYSGDPNYLGSTSPPVTESVGLTATSTALTVTPGPVAYGQPVTMTATVAPSGATGTVNFMDGTATLGSQTLTNGTASFTTSSLPAGSHTLSAVYGGDSNFATSTSPTVTEMVTKGNSTTVLTVSPNPASVGQLVTMTATVTPSTATGLIAFLDAINQLGNGTVSNGVATFTTSTLSPGTHSLIATFSGDANNNLSTSAEVTETVNSPNPLANIIPTSLATAFVGLPYSQTFAVTGGTLPLTWTLASGTVPGLTLSTAGVLSGTPTTPTTTPIQLTVRVDDSAGQATAIVVSLTVLPLPAPTISIQPILSLTDQPAPQVTVSPAYPLALTATFSLSFTPSAANLPANYVNPDVKFAGGSTTTGPISFPANSTAPVTLPAIQLGTVAGTITVTLASLTTNTGQSVLPANPVTATITVPATAPVIVPGSVRIINIASTGFSVFLDGSSTTRDLISASLTFSAASGDQLNGTQFTVSLTTASTAWFSDTGANRGVANGGSFSLTLPFNYSGDTNAIGTVTVTVTNSVGTSTAVSGGR